MFQRLSGPIVRTWPCWLAGWGLLLAVLWTVAPLWSSVTRGGEFAFLPASSPSLRAEQLRRLAFPQDRTQSSVVLVVHRAGGLQPRDWQFLAAALIPALEKISSQPAGHSMIVGIRSFQDQFIGPLLVSNSREATLVLVNLAAEMFQRESRWMADRIQREIDDLRRREAIPHGLAIGITGSAAIGRDLVLGEARSAQAIERWTIWIIIGLLLLVYRRPFLALLPLASLACAVQITLKILTLLAQAGYIGLFSGLEVYTTVLVYGAGVDFSLFLISRYEEEAAAGPDLGAALARALARVGTAITASAAVEIIGIGMLVFAAFGKFQQAGVSISLALFILLCTTLTLVPALLQLLGRWAFWPIMPCTHADAWPGRGWLGRLAPTRWAGNFWKRTGMALGKRPGTFWTASVVLMAPLAVVAVRRYQEVSYGLLDDLPPSSVSYQGTNLLERYFPAGIAGPLTVLVRDDRVDFNSWQGLGLIETLTGRLQSQRKQLGLVDLRTASAPLGVTPAAREAVAGGGVASPFVQQLIRIRAARQYVSDSPQLDHHVTRIDLVLAADPLSRGAIDALDQLERAMENTLPGQLRGARLYFLGTTASLRDLQRVSDIDRTRIPVLVTAAVLAVLVILLCKLAIPVYLILTVLFSFFVTIGLSDLVFRAIQGPSFPGLDWTVAVFLFTLLMAIGEDYNIFLITRVKEEQEQYGPVQGVTEAVERTGAIISACGVIMAGTFCSLIVGSILPRLYQLGFALAFGVLLDTFVVRPILVPSFLILLYSGRFGRLGKLLGAGTVPKRRPATGPETRVSGWRGA